MSASRLVLLAAHLSTACKALLAECPNQAAMIATHSQHVWPVA